MEEHGIATYIVILDDGETTFSTHSVEPGEAINILGFMEVLKHDLLHSLKENEIEMEGSE